MKKYLRDYSNTILLTSGETIEPYFKRKERKIAA